MYKHEALSVDRNVVADVCYRLFDCLLRFCDSIWQSLLWRQQLSLTDNAQNTICLVQSVLLDLGIEACWTSHGAVALQVVFSHL